MGCLHGINDAIKVTLFDVINEDRGTNNRDEVSQPVVQIKMVELYVPPILFPGLRTMPKYAKFMKDLLTNKAKFKETSKVTLNERCSFVLLNRIPLNEKDPRSFTISCAIGIVGTDKELANLGAGISLMPYSMFIRLELGDLKPTRMYIELANKSTQYPMGIAENVIVKIDKFVFPIEFLVLDMEKDYKIPIILGRPFLATAHAIIDETHPKDQLDSFLFEPIKDFQPKKDINLWEYDSEIVDFENSTLFAPSTVDMEKPIPKLKEFPSHLEYAFQDGNKEFPIIISSLLSHQGKGLLLQVLLKHKLNPKVQDIVKAEIIKLLDAGLIYAISDSPWISPIHVIPKKGGMIVIINEKNELVPTRTVTGWRIPLALEDQEKTTFTCPYGTFTYRRMLFDLVTLQPHSKDARRCKETNLVLNWEKCHFMVKEGIVLGHKISGASIEVDRAKVVS
ncbi:putative nucleotidyltransferase, ribonuclease H [Tanacetum coccineum]|uniref:Nucleotidyltransferase, ribonuclease H n=1 Tax=Tanacetum coccineum TaxID=301880 RepID=A0ABQ5H330_9ASTR